jgi:CheY-like chemotaxis protein
MALPLTTIIIYLHVSNLAELYVRYRTDTRVRFLVRIRATQKMGVPASRIRPSCDFQRLRFIPKTLQFQFQSGRSALVNRRILFVDDHDDTRFMIKVWLSQLDYEVATAESLADGLRLAQGEPFDLYILDTNLPDGKGPELCIKIREFDPTTPIIFYTGEPREQLNAELKVGAQEYVMKPEIGDLEKAILRAMKTVRA